uniref:Uncharacterized protein n=1 Tax=Rhizophora mucronata TaxID=61149 RepID=A0A2P2PGQ6_RHIMU
MSASERER